MMTMNRLHEVIQCIKRVGPYVDRIVIVDGGSTDDTILTLRNWKGVEFYLHKWNDNFSGQRNNYLRAAELNGGTDWILVSDPDELYSEEACKNMKRMISELPPRYNMISFESHSVTLKGEEVVHKSADNYYKQLLFKWNPGIHYVGNPHETLMIENGQRVWASPYHYYHIKQDKMCWPRGARNAFIGGGGPNMGDRQKLWRPFRQLVKDVTGIDDWNSFNEYMVKGNIDQRIKDEMCKFRFEKNYDGASEWREIYKTYFRIYHPEEELESIRQETIE
jgi:glycosyltransferase involved in cell wall biosynthesis